MPANRGVAGIGSFACAFGDAEVKAQDIPGFEEIWQDVSFGTDFADMGCSTFRRMTAPAEDYVVDAVRRTLQRVTPADVDHLVLATSDPVAGFLPPDFAARVLLALRLTTCVPHLVSFQRCCSSLAALQYGERLFADPAVRRVVVVAMDFVPEDHDRVRSYALFGDAVASCLLTRDDPGLVRLVSTVIRVDEDGLRGRDSFASRRAVADSTLSAALRAADRELGQITAVFSANLYQPLTVFNASSIGLRPDTLHFTDTLAAYGHCGNADWMINLVDYDEKVGVAAGRTYLAQSIAPGLYACGLLEGSSSERA